MTIEFRPFQKISRLSRETVITEKIDGTNASITIAPSIPEHDDIAIAYDKVDGVSYSMLAGSRTRWITPEDDNFGFARWAQDNSDELFDLGEGTHFGEWWGQGIQRNYGLTERRFSLFNVSRWAVNPHPSCCGVVPVLFRGPFDTAMSSNIIENLREYGSHAVPGFMKPEGIVVFHSAANLCFKKTLDKDESPKGQV